jgi:hypothetical protein
MKRWTEACTEILKRMASAGYTDQEIADHIADRTGERFHRNKILQERRDRMISACRRCSPRARAYRLGLYEIAASSVG